MNADTRAAVDSAFVIVQNRYSQRWMRALNKGLFGGNTSWHSNDNQALFRAGGAVLQEIASKAADLTDEVKKVFDAHKDFPTVDEQPGLVAKLDNQLQDDAQFVSTLLEKVDGFKPQDCRAPQRALFDQAALDRGAQIHAFTLMLVATRNAHSAATAAGASPAAQTVHVSGSNPRVEVGDRRVSVMVAPVIANVTNSNVTNSNVNSNASTSVAAGSSDRKGVGFWGWIAAIGASAIAGLIVAWVTGHLPWFK